MSRLVLLLSISYCLMGCKSSSQRKGAENEVGTGERDLPRETAVKVLHEPSKPIGELLKKLRRGMTLPMVRKALPSDLFWSLDSCDGHRSLVEGFELGDDVFVAFSYVNAEAKGNYTYTPEESEDHLKLEKALAVPIRREYRGGVYTLTREFDSPLVVVVYGKESEQAVPPNGP